MAMKLTSCPFCGGTDVHNREGSHSWSGNNFVAVFCDDCHAMGPMAVLEWTAPPKQGDYENAAQAWNHRHRRRDTYCYTGD